MNRARAIHSDSRRPPSLWGECMKAAGYIKNRMPMRTLKKKTPFEVWYGRRPDLSNLRELGCKAWVYTMGDNPKIYNRSTECILVGYSENSKAYRCWDRATGRIHVTRNVTFSKSKDLVPRPLHPGVIMEGIPVDSEAGGTNTTDETGAKPVDVLSAIDPPTEPRKSTRTMRPSTAGAASKGIPHVSAMEHVRKEIWESENRLKTAQMVLNETKDDTLASFDDDGELCCLSSDDDPKDYRDAMSRADSAEWTMSISEEIQLLRITMCSH
jgi:hypothetical protein